MVRIARKVKAPLRGITVDNPYDYAIGRIKAAGQPYDANKLEWLKRVLDIEKYVHAHGLEFNLIINSEAAGATSMKMLRDETLEFLDLYRKHGGKPDRYIVQSWYTHPKHDEVVPESSPDTFTGLVKDVIRRVKGI